MRREAPQSVEQDRFTYFIFQDPLCSRLTGVLCNWKGGVMNEGEEKANGRAGLTIGDQRYLPPWPHL